MRTRRCAKSPIQTPASRGIRLATLASICLAGCASAHKRDVSPLPHAHAHNDYAQSRPLHDALALGFTSIEVDVHLVGDALLVGHDPEDLRADRTLRTMYLAPLRERIRDHGGNACAKQTHPLQLLIDIKTDAEPTYAVLHAILVEYAPLLTVVCVDRIHPGAMHVVVSGNRPAAVLERQRIRLAALDGRLSDLESNLPPHLLPLISASYPDHFGWTGHGAPPATETAKLRDIVTRAHARGRNVRFWATPECERVWKWLLDNGVDFIGTDELTRLAAFFHPP